MHLPLPSSADSRLTTARAVDGRLRLLRLRRGLQGLRLLQVALWVLVGLTWVPGIWLTLPLVSAGSWGWYIDPVASLVGFTAGMVVSLPLRRLCRAVSERVLDLQYAFAQERHRGELQKLQSPSPR